MSKTDLDWLTEEASPEEIKHLMRIAHEWSQGDEHSFPVQLALLTRAQWRAAAMIPRSLNDSQRLLEAKLTEYRQQTATLINNLSITGEVQAKKLAEVVSAHSKSVTQATSEAAAHFMEAAQVADDVGAGLRSAATAWQCARREFEAERERLAQARRELERHWTRNEWMAVSFIALFLLILGFSFGFTLARR